MRNFVTLLFFSILGVSPISALDNPDNIHPPNQSECAVKKPFKQSLEQKKVEQVKELAERYEALKQLYKDDEVSSTFEQGRIDLGKFVGSVMSQHFATEGEPLWYYNYRAALESVTNDNFEKAQIELVKAQINYAGRTGPNFPDVLMLSALVENVTEQTDRCLAHLTLLYELHKKAPLFWTNSEIFNTRFK
jgi:hypothetical protein